MFLFVASLSTAQSVSINGTVKNSMTKESLPSVTVNIKGTEINSMTNEKGIFRIVSTSPPPIILVFTSVSFEPYEITVSSRENNVDVEMNPRFFIENPLVVGATLFRSW